MMIKSAERNGAAAKTKTRRPGEEGYTPLSEMVKTGTAVIGRICCETPETKRLRELGFVEGGRIALVLARRKHEPAALRIGETRLCVNQETASHFWLKSIR